ncbi:MAG: GlsB/YeaQ/YmgE family stress response membrane protein [Verrucomicrobiales bacterium]|nr:GlsB/YeaQ/YmgE family stress response membrane protein [Verrucomicrobiales bacterium]
MGALTWIIFGLLAGALAKFIIPGKDPGGCVVTTIIGIVGAFIGGWLGTMFGWGTVNDFNIKSMALAVGGAVILLLIFRLIAGRKG